MGIATMPELPPVLMVERVLALGVVGTTWHYP